MCLSALCKIENDRFHRVQISLIGQKPSVAKDGYVAEDRTIRMQNGVMRFIFAASLCALAAGQAGAVNRCVDNRGKVTYQDAECPEAAHASVVDTTAGISMVRRQNPSVGQATARVDPAYTTAKGAWRGPAQFQFSVSGVRDQGAQVVTPLVVELKESGEVTGVMSEAGCKLSGLATQFVAPNAANVDVTLKDCSDHRFNARFGGYLVVSASAKEAKLTLNALGWAVPTSKFQQASLEAVLKR